MPRFPEVGLPNPGPLLVRRAGLLCLAASLVWLAGALTGCSRGGDERPGRGSGESAAANHPGPSLAAVESVLARHLTGWASALPAPGGDVDGGSGPEIRCRRVTWTGDWPPRSLADSLRAPLAAVGAAVLWQEPLAGGGWRLDLGSPGRPTHTLALVPAGFAGDVRWKRADAKQSEASPPAQDAAQDSAQVTENDTVLVALVIDDCGQRLTGAAGEILALPVPLTLAVLPGLPKSREVAALATPLLGADDAATPATAPPSGAPATRSDDEAHRRRLAAGCPVEVSLTPAATTAARREILLHLPMQPVDFPATDPGPGALLVGMDAFEVIARLDQALASVPGARGVNNHMGSAATADPALMATLMAALHARGLLFLDSLTSSQSVAWRQARDAGLPSLRNRLFLDVDHTDEVSIAANLAELVRVARASGQAVGIGHPHAATAAVLARDLPRYEAEGVRFVTVSELLALRSETRALRLSARPREPETAHAQ